MSARLLVRVGNARTAQERLLVQHQCLRHCAPFGLPQYLRVSMRTLPECQRLAESLPSVVASG